jgi:hypothetical protein
MVLHVSCTVHPALHAVWAAVCATMCPGAGPARCEGVLIEQAKACLVSDTRTAVSSTAVGPSLQTSW